MSCAKTFKAANSELDSAGCAVKYDRQSALGNNSPAWIIESLTERTSVILRPGLSLGWLKKEMGDH